MIKKLSFKLLIVLLISFSVVATYRLYRPGFFSMQDDMHVFRLQQFDMCLKDLQIPCRYIRDGGMGYGYPLYNYYSPLPYAFAESFHLIGLQYIDSIKLAFIAPAFIRSISMYLLASSFFGPLGGILSSALYTLAPYQAVDTYVRGALAETWALSLLPLVLWAIYKKKQNWLIISLSTLLLSHNLTLIYFLPMALVFSYLTKNFAFFTKNSFFAAAISAFFVLPAFLEKNLVTAKTMTEGYFNFVNHFATLKQLFISNFWGYGASLWGPVDDMSFSIGYLQWILPLIVVIGLLKFKKTTHRSLIYAIAFIGLLALFITHNKSTLIWQALPFMPYFQFPWRFLGLAILCFSFISGAITTIPALKQKSLVYFLVILTIIINFSYFKEDIWYGRYTDSDKLTPAEVYRQSGAGLKDYWPKGSQSFPTTMTDNTVNIRSGDANIIIFNRSSDSINGTVEVSSDSSEVLLPMVYFPNWELSINGIKTPISTDPLYNQVKLNLSKGNHNFTLALKNTPIRTISNLISIFGLVFYILRIYKFSYKTKLR